MVLDADRPENPNHRQRWSSTGRINVATDDGRVGIKGVVDVFKIPAHLFEQSEKRPKRKSGSHLPRYEVF
jgi:hypothetical protein